MSTHTNYIWAVFLFYRKRYSGLPSLQNKCFLFLNLLDWHYQHKRNPLFEVVIFAFCTFLLNPELPK